MKAFTQKSQKAVVGLICLKSYKNLIWVRVITLIYKQIGNAVPVNLAKAIAEEVMKVLN